MIRPNSDQMMINKAEYKEMKANADSWVASQKSSREAPKAAKPKSKPPIAKPKPFFGGK